MGVSAFTGPLLVFGEAPSSGLPAYNSQQGTSLFASGAGIMDPRPAFGYSPGGADSNPACGFLTASRIAVLDQVPSAIAAANIAASQAPVAGTPLTLVSTSGAGITVGASLTNQNTGVAATALAIDGVPARAAQGSTGTVQLWNPGTLLSRNVRITSVGNDSGATFLVSGYDIYGAPMSERITGANAGVASGRKSFKYIASVTPAGTLSGSNVSVGTGDVYGFPILVASWPYVDIYVNGALITSSTGFTAPDATSPATSTTGDVRGTYALQTASNGTLSIQAFVTPTVGNVSSIAGLFGQPQS